MNVFLVGFLIFFIITFTLIFNKDRFIGLFYFVLFVYCYFTIFAYTYYPEQASLTNCVGIDKTIFFQFKLYIILSFAFFNIFYFIIFRRYRISKTINNKNRNIKLTYSLLDTKEIKPYKLFFIIIATFFGVILGRFLYLNFGQLSYYNQSVLKSNKIIYLMYDYCFILIFICFLTFKKYKKSIYGKVCFVAGLLITLIFLLISLKIGSRGVFIGYALAICYYICEKYNIKIKLSYLKQMLIITLVVLITIGFSQLIRNTRGGVVDFKNINFLFSDVQGFFKLEQLVFQDYVTPSATLIYSIKEKLVIPGTVIFSDILNIPVILDYITLSEHISRLVSPFTAWGMGYYILTWGYNLIGFMGCVFTPLVLVILFKLYYRVFFYLNDHKFGLFIQTVLAVYLILPIVRGQMYPFIKDIYVYFIPTIVLYCMATGVKISFKKQKNKMVNN